MHVSPFTASRQHGQYRGARVAHVRLAAYFAWLPAFAAAVDVCVYIYIYIYVFMEIML